MGLFSWLFGNGDRPGGAKAASAGDSSFEFSDRFVDIRKYGMFGQFARSPNGRYLLVWRDSYGITTNGKSRRVSGRYMLLDGERLLCDDKMERPNDGKVADDGVFILNDWHDFTGELRGTFCAFRPDGSAILKRDFKANLYNNGLSRDGRWAACQTCNAPDETDGSVLTVFDLEAAKEYARWRAESGWPDSYEFSENGSKVLLGVRDLGKFAYSLDGEFLDRNAWLDAGVEQGDIYIIGNLLSEIEGDQAEETLRRALAGLDRALQKPANSDPRTRAHILKLKGDCFDRLKNWKDALVCFDEALELNPKVGAKRRSSQIRKTLTEKDKNA